ncbi:hypothetical protein EJ110_NYTH33788 [Nymphaea thermarum]|nr:hypothetical protein EJ110_NYTH33788 [Nymphaea thermarum]
MTLLLRLGSSVSEGWEEDGRNNLLLRACIVELSCTTSLPPQPLPSTELFYLAVASLPAYFLMQAPGTRDIGDAFAFGSALLFSAVSNKVPAYIVDAENFFTRAAACDIQGSSGSRDIL